MAFLFLIVVFLPAISYFQALQTRWGITTDLFFFWKDKFLWAMSYLALFSIKKIPSPVIVFLGFLFISTLFSQDMYLSMWGMPNYSEGSITFLCYAILFIAAENFSDIYFEVSSQLSVFLITFLAFIQIIYGNYLNFPPIKYLSGLSHISTISAGRFPLYMSFANPNHLGLYCALLFPIFIRTNIWYMSSILGVMALGSESRAALLAIILTLPRKSWKYLWPGALIGVSYVIFKHGFSFTTGGRFFMWKNTIPLLNLLGHGPATLILDFPQKLVETSGIGWPKGELVDRPHNLYLQIAHATGLLSLLPLGWVVVKAVRKESIYRYGVFGFLLCALFTDSVVSVTPIFCILLGMCYGRDSGSV